MLEACHEKIARQVIGNEIGAIETPALLVDLDLMEQNIERMREFLSHGTVGIRPHAKTHKTPEIALLQMKYGALGITAAKIGEAEALAAGGVKDIMIANQIIGDGKIQRAVRLSKKIDLKVAVDSEENLRDISRLSQKLGGSVGIVIEVDVGLKRAGVRDVESAINLARLASSLPGVTYRGIMGYEGHCVFIEDLEERKKKAGESYDRLISFRDALDDAGLKPEIVSCGGTGTFMLGGLKEGMTDIEAGSYIFMDARYKGIQGVDFKQSLTVLSTIVSHAEEDLWVCDAGLKSMTREFGLVETLPSYGLKVKSMSEEHISLIPSEVGRQGMDVPPAWSDLDGKYARKTPRPLKVGDKVHLIPSHCCTTVNLHDLIYAVRDGIVQDVWRVTGRGRFA